MENEVNQLISDGRRRKIEKGGGERDTKVIKKLIKGEKQQKWNAKLEYLYVLIYHKITRQNIAVTEKHRERGKAYDKKEKA